MYRQQTFLYTPPDETKLWRYVDLSHFLWLLSQRSLYFANLTEFDDHWEGALPLGSIEGLKRFLASVEVKDLGAAINEPDVDIHVPGFDSRVQRLEALLRLLQANYGVNCWHSNDVESVAMWKLYTRGKDGVAIQTTVGRLKACLSHDVRDIYIALVNYLDHDVLPVEELILPNALIPVITKRRSFEHESEVRLILNRGLTNQGLRQSLSGEVVAVDINNMIERIVASPDYPGWGIANLQDIVAAASLHVCVERSDLLRRPRTEVPHTGHADRP